MCQYIRSNETTLTPHKDLQFAEVCCIVDRKLQNDVSACRHVAGTLEGDGDARRYGTGVLATHVVVPQGRSDDIGRGVRQTDNEIVRSLSIVYTTINQFPHHTLTLPYLTLPYAEDVLPPSAEASNQHLEVTIPLPREGLLT